MLTMEAAIFDLDGVIVDTAKYHFLAWKRLAAELGFEFTTRDNERLKGVSRMRSLEIVLEVGGIAASDAQKAMWADQKNRWYVEYIQALTPGEILPDIVPFIAGLWERGVKIALGSASKNAMTILAGLKIGALFDAISDGNKVARAKPDPEVFLTAARELGVAPDRCIVFEDAAAGIAAARNAGMRVIGIGDPVILGGADLVAPNFCGLSPSLVTGDPAEPDFLLQEESFSPEHIELNGSKFLLGNGYMGYRGTLEENAAQDQVACTLAGVYDRAGRAWREPVNAPNGLYTLLRVNDRPLHAAELLPAQHQQTLDLRRAVHRRETCFAMEQNTIRVTAERFLSLDNVHRLVMQYSFRCEAASRVEIQTGIDGAIWDINGPHLKTIRFEREKNGLAAVAVTNEGDTVAVSEVMECNFGSAESVIGAKGVYHRIVMQAEAGREYRFNKYVSVYTGKDGLNPEDAAKTDAGKACETGFDILLLRHAYLWQKRWLQSDVVIAGDPQAQFALRYSIYQLLTGAADHRETSIPARSLSGQTYKGAIFWDTEMFMLPFFTYTPPQLARNIIKYRVHTLDGARRKAAEYGFKGAFYAWESQETGDDACTLFNVTDVFSGRPMRTYFRDKQIHISADVVYGIWQYYRLTGDESILREGGAEVLLECARFFSSYAYYKKDKMRYELLDVTGPDEYHERVANNAFTNYMVKYSLGAAIAVLDKYQTHNPAFYRQLVTKLHMEDEIPVLRGMHNQLYLPAPESDSGIIEQFDGYHRLEDVALAELKGRIKIPNEYLGGGNGLATTTKILKQADVVALLNIFKQDFSHDIKKANWEYYEPRTEHGSSLSSCIYAIVASDIGKADWAYQYFLNTATIDLTGDYKRFVGDLYIGGTHPAANGGAWMAAVLGFGGLDCDGEVATIKPALPAHWQALSFSIRIKNQGFKVAISKSQVKIIAAWDNTKAVKFQIGGKAVICGSRQETLISLK